MALTTDTAHKALAYRLHRRRQTADTVGVCHPYTPFTDAPG